MKGLQQPFSPEGSEARVRLQSAVIDQVVKRIVLKELSTIKWVVDNAAQRHFEDCKRQLGLVPGRYNSSELSDSLKATIKAHAQGELEAAIKGGLNATPQAIEELRTLTLERVDKRIAEELQYGLEARINKLVKAALKSAINT